MNAGTMPGHHGRLRRAGPGVAGVVLAGVLVWLGFWLMERPLVRGHGPDYQQAPAAKPASAAGAEVLTRAGLPAHAAADLPGAALPRTAYAVAVGDADTPAGAILRLRQVGAFAPAGTYVPVEGALDTAYRVVVGAAATSDNAGQLLRDLRGRGELSETSGTVVHVPLAFLIERDVAATAAAARVAAFAARGLPVYALRQADGRAWLYAGAFASAADTALLGSALRNAGVHATLAYRTGRPF